MCAATGEGGDLGAVQRAPRDSAHGTGTDERSIRCLYAQEHLLFTGPRPRRRDVGIERVADILGQRQCRLAARLSRDMQGTPVPVDIAKTQADDVAGTQSQTCQEQEDGPVTHACRAVAAGRDAALDIVGADVARQS